MVIEHKILSFCAITGSIQVHYYTADFPTGFVYNIDIPVSDSGYPAEAEVENLIKLMCPTEQIKRVTALKSIKPPDSFLGLVNINQQEPLDALDKAQQVRGMRNNLLSESDFSQLPDVLLSVEEKAAWVEYRQELRDLTKQSGFPDVVVFPVPPFSEPR
jgi:hypothetical protein